MLFLTAGDITALELFEARYAIEPETAAMAASRRTQADLDELREIWEQSVEPGLDVAEFAALDFKFHHRVAGMSQNRLLRTMHEQIGPHYAIYSERAVSIPGRRERACEGHHQIMDAIVRKDPEGARDAAVAHLRSAERDIARAASQND